ncbi:hypothetical protein G6F45_014236 [Rhizopus arrhizus]|nr:hypothetical protein G6F45_014236 [Rhizopus arrhizus]
MRPARRSTSTPRYQWHRRCVAGSASRTRPPPSSASTCGIRSAGPTAFHWGWAHDATMHARRPTASPARPTTPPPIAPA